MQKAKVTSEEEQDTVYTDLQSEIDPKGHRVYNSKTNSTGHRVY